MEVVLKWKMVYVLILLDDISIRKQVYLKIMICNMNLKEVIYFLTFPFNHILITVAKLHLVNCERIHGLD